MNAHGKYRKGARNEYKSIRLFEAEGYLFIRSAGSHSPFDIVAVSGDRIVLIQCKTNSWPSPAECETLRSIPVPEHTIKLVHRWNDRSSLPVVKELASTPMVDED